IDRGGVHASGRIERLCVAAPGTEQRRVELVAVAGDLEIGADALRGLRVDREGLAPAALALHAQRIETPGLVEIPDIQGGNLRAPETDLEADGENGPN